MDDMMPDHLTSWLASPSNSSWLHHESNCPSNRFIRMRTPGFNQKSVLALSNFNVSIPVVPKNLAVETISLFDNILFSLSCRGVHHKERRTSSRALCIPEAAIGTTFCPAPRSSALNRFGLQ
jgi:hypothetical protein